MCIERSLLDLINNSCRPKVPVQYNSLSLLLGPSLIHTHTHEREREGRADTNRFSPPLLLLLLLQREIFLHFFLSLSLFFLQSHCKGKKAHTVARHLKQLFSSSRLKHLFSYLISGHTQRSGWGEEKRRADDVARTSGKKKREERKEKTLLCHNRFIRHRTSTKTKCSY